ncbi:MAG: NAD(P)/FAD-dependent oxidoreductase [Euryarchaeota archaeon]|nr:NAD(P)/FAD-dependent oxidoreductase [Euryarchaeota archaeon]
MRCELAVVGAGVAGACAAHAAATRGVKVLLLEKEALPRYKLCGGAVTRKTLELLAGEGIRLPRRLFHEVRRVRVKIPGAERELRVPENSILTTYRDILDHALVREAERAGAEVLEKARVKEVRRGQGCWRVSTTRGEVEARFLLGCDGVSSVVRRSLFGWRFPPDELGVAAEYEVEGLSLDAMEIHFGHASFSYAWAFPKREGATIGVAELASRLEEGIFDRLERFAATLPYLRSTPKPRSHPIPMGGIRRRVALGEAALAGDAAGFVEPLSGEGTYYAALSGIMAGKLVGRVLEGREENLLAYQRFCDSQLLPQLRAMLYLGRLFYFKPDFSYHLFENTDVLIGVIAALAGGEPPPRLLLRQAILTSLRHLPGYLARKLSR